MSKTIKIIVGLLLLLVLISSCNLFSDPWNIKNPKMPSAPEPNDILYCEKDEDCTITTYEENSCCLSCPNVINKQGQLYLEEWYNLNCKYARTDKCATFICDGYSELKCESNKCKGIEFDN